MYEAEVNDIFEPIGSIPAAIQNRFAEYRREISARTTLPWGEHCTECNWPTCYTSCELYSPRTDGACRQFLNGMVRIDYAEGVNPYLLKLQFKQWAKLWTVGNLELQDPSVAARREKLNMAIGALGRKLTLPRPLRRRVLGKINYLRRTSAEKRKERGIPDYFVLECYNPEPKQLELTLTVRRREQPGHPQFQRKLRATPGFTRARVVFGEMATAVDMSQAFEVEIVPNDAGGSVLYLGLADFVKERRDLFRPGTPSPPRKLWKCIVWDLDNTLWDGILVEDGVSGIRLRSGVLDVIKETDRRGILHSIASKNNPEEAMTVLRQLGIDRSFLHPQIRWQPKSQSLVQIAQRLNIGVETIAFVDDQEFEREEVRSAMPDVATIDAAHYATIPERPECCVPVTEESRNRRLMYREQQKRKETETAYAGDYLKFLRDCQLTIDMSRLKQENVERVYELAQRTNQMNFSGNRYPRERLKEIMDTRGLDTYVLKCTDRFGSYGVVGFAVVETSEPRLLDLMFSCRIQGKRVEHAFLSALLQRFVAGQRLDFHANYRKTPKNTPAGRVFEELGFETCGENDGVSSLVFRRGREIPDDKIILIREEGSD